MIQALRSLLSTVTENTRNPAPNEEMNKNYSKLLRGERGKPLRGGWVGWASLFHLVPRKDELSGADEKRWVRNPGRWGSSLGRGSNVN